MDTKYMKTNSIYHVDLSYLSKRDNITCLKYQDPINIPGLKSGTAGTSTGTSSGILKLFSEMLWINRSLGSMVDDDCSCPGKGGGPFCPRRSPGSRDRKIKCFIIICASFSL